MIKHDIEELRQWQSLSLPVKILMSNERIRNWYKAYNGNVYVSRSGGKDSDVLGRLVYDLYPSVPHVFVDTGLELDSVRQHAILSCAVILRPQINFRDVIIKYGYPVIGKEVAKCVYQCQKGREKNPNYYSTSLAKLQGEYRDKDGNLSMYNFKEYEYLLEAPFRISSMCCDVMKKEPFSVYSEKTSRMGITGVLACESKLRTLQWLQHGCNGYNLKTPICNPLSFWTEQDILQYIKEYDVNIADIYGDVIYDGSSYHTSGADRTGCSFCMFGIEYDTERYLRLKETEPKKYDYVMRGGKFDSKGYWIPDNGLGYVFVIDWLNEHGGYNIKY